MHLFLVLSVALSTFAAAGPLPFSISNTLSARAPASSTQEGKVTEPKESRSIHNASPTDDKGKNPAIILHKRGFWDNIGDDVGDGIVDYLNDMACHDSALADDPCQKKKSRSIQEDANHIDEEEKPAVVLPERGLWDDVVGEDADDIGDDTEDALNDLACDESALTDKPCEKKKSRSIDDASHTDDEEKPAVVLPKRDYIHDIWMTIKCASEEDFEDRCGCPGVYC